MLPGSNDHKICYFIHSNKIDTLRGARAILIETYVGANDLPHIRSFQVFRFDAAAMKKGPNVWCTCPLIDLPRKSTKPGIIRRQLQFPYSLRQNALIPNRDY